MGLKTLGKARVTVAGKRQVEVDVSAAHIGVSGREPILAVAVMDTPKPLPGISTLEALGLSVTLKPASWSQSDLRCSWFDDG